MKSTTAVVFTLLLSLAVIVHSDYEYDIVLFASPTDSNAEMYTAFVLAVQDINAHGRYPFQLNHVLYNISAYEPDVLGAVATAIDNHPNLLSIVGPLSDSWSPAVYASLYTIPMVSPTSTSMQYSLKDSFPYLFRLMPGDYYAFSTALLWMLQTDWSNAMMLVSSAMEWSISFVDDVSAGSGITVWGTRVFEHGVSSVSEVETDLLHLRGMGGTIYLLAILEEDCELVYDAAASAGLLNDDNVFIAVGPTGPIWWDGLTFVGLDLNRSHSAEFETGWAARTSPDAPMFSDSGASLYDDGNGLPCLLCGMAYDAVAIVASAFDIVFSKTANMSSSDRGSVLHDTLLTNTYDGLYGEVEFNPYQDRLIAFSLFNCYDMAARPIARVDYLLAQPSIVDYNLTVYYSVNGLTVPIQDGRQPVASESYVENGSIIDVATASPVVFVVALRNRFGAAADTSTDFTIEASFRSYPVGSTLLEEGTLLTYEIVDVPSALYGVEPKLYVNLTVLETGTYVMRVTINGEHIVGSPLAVLSSDSNAEAKVYNLALYYPWYDYASIRGFRDVVNFAVETVNNNDTLLSDRILSYVHYNGTDTESAIHDAYDLVLRSLDTVVGVDGSYFSSISETIQYIFKSYNIPQLSCCSEAARLSDSEVYPTFFRVFPAALAKSLTQVIAALDWLHFSTIYPDDETGADLNTDVIHWAQYWGLIMDYSFIYEVGNEQSLRDVLTTMQDRDVRIVCVLVDESDLEATLRLAGETGMIDDGRAWVGGSVLVKDLGPEYDKYLRGSLAIEAFVEDGAEELFPEDLRDNLTSVYSYYLYDSIFVYVHAMDQLLSRGESPLNRTAMLEALAMTNMRGTTGTITFDENGDRVGAYSFVNHNGEHWQKLGAFTDKDTDLDFNEDAIVWHGQYKPLDVIEHCPTGMFFNTSNYVCSDCPPGSRGPSASEPATECVECSPGTWSVTGDTCRSCSSGSYVGESGAAVCVQCVESRTCPEGATTVSECTCEGGYFHEDPAAYDDPCKECPENAVCDGGDTIPYAPEDVWVANTTAAYYHDYFFHCTSRGCVGGIEACGPEYTGSMCASCSPGYFHIGNECVACEHTEFSIRYFLLLVVVLFTWLPMMRLASLTFPSLYSTIAFLQILSTIQGMRVPWPRTVDRMLYSVSVVNFNLFVCEFECYTSVDAVYRRTFLTYMVLPLVFIGIVVALIIAAVVYRHLVSYFRKRIPHIVSSSPTYDLLMQRSFIIRLLRPAEVGDIILWGRAFLLFMLNQTYMMVSTKSIEVQNCKEYTADGDSFVMAFASEDCSGSRYTALQSVGVLGILVYLLGIPLGFLYLLFVYGKDKRDDYRFTTAFGFFYTRFRDDCYWWEFVTLSRKVMFSAVKLIRNEELQVFAGVFVIAVNLTLHVYMMPFKRVLYNMVELCLHASTLMILICGLVYLIDTDAEGSLGVIFICFGLGAALFGFGWDLYDYTREWLPWASANKETELTEFPPTPPPPSLSAIVIRPGAHMASHSKLVLDVSRPWEARPTPPPWHHRTPRGSSSASNGVHRTPRESSGQAVPFVANPELHSASSPSLHMKNSFFFRRGDTNGANGVNGVNGVNGINGVNGACGVDGELGGFRVGSNGASAIGAGANGSAVGVHLDSLASNRRITPKRPVKTVDRSKHQSRSSEWALKRSTSHRPRPLTQSLSEDRVSPVRSKCNGGRVHADAVSCGSSAAAANGLHPGSVANDAAADAVSCGTNDATANGLHPGSVVDTALR
eukprot:Rmarinus@m.27060